MLYHLPPEVLAPAFEAAATNGYLTRQDGQLAVTEAGALEVSKLVTALKAWLADELADWGADDPELSRALGDLASQFVNQDPQQVPGPLGLFASAR